MKSKTHIRYGFVLVAGALIAATPAKAQSRLDEYIREGLNSNQSIKQQDFVLEKNVYALKEANHVRARGYLFNNLY